MATTSEAHSSTYVENSSEDECLSSVKRKAEADLEDAGEKSGYDDDSDDDPIMAGVLVTVEVEEMDGDTPLEFGKVDKPKKKKRKKQVGSKKKKGKRFQCLECNAQFDTSPELKTHSLEHQVVTRHKCEICNRYFKKAFSLRMHAKVHMEKSAPRCVLCGLVFNQRNELSQHMETHPRSQECQKCDAKYHTEQQLTNHLNKMHHGWKKELERKPNSKNQQHDNTNQSSEMEQGDNTQSDQDIQDESGKLMPFFFSEFDPDPLSREELSYHTKCAIISKMHKGRSIPDICRLYNLTPELVNELWEEREKYALPKKQGKRSTKYMNSILDSRIVEWYKVQRANEVQVSGKMLQDIAEAFAKDCGFVAFNGSKKWLDRFKKRYSITLRGTPSKRDYNNPYDSKWKNHFFKEQWSDARLGMPDEDIYTADEFGFYYNPSKGRIKKMAGKKFIQGHVKDRLAIFLCANMTGTDKKKLVVCGTEDPLIHSFRDPDTLPVTYIRHSQAHFTTPMFEEYVKYWNRELEMRDRKAILVLDRATIHTKLQLSHLKLVFVPWKATNGLIPMKNGVFAKFREEFRRLVIEEKAMNALRGVDRNVTCLEALNMLDKAWERTPPECITKSFVDTGYDVTVPDEFPEVEKPKVHENDEEILCNMLKDYDVESYFTNVSTLDQYLTVDEELVTGQGTNCSVFGGNHRVVEPMSSEKDKEDLLPLATDKPETSDKEMLVKKSRALQDLDIVRKYLQSNTTSYDAFCCFMEMEKFVMQTVIA